MKTLHRNFLLIRQGKVVSGTHAESAVQALETMNIVPDDVVVESASGTKVIFRYNNEIYTLVDTGYF